jgi:hypothetical protein
MKHATVRLCLVIASAKSTLTEREKKQDLDNQPASTKREVALCARGGRRQTERAHARERQREERERREREVKERERERERERARASERASERERSPGGGVGENDKQQQAQRLDVRKNSTCKTRSLCVSSRAKRGRIEITRAAG